MSAATPSGGTAPANAIAAALNIADNPTANISALYNLIAANAPFQPAAATTPSDYTVGLITPAGLAMSPTALVFPAAYVSFTSAPQTVTVTNTGTNPVGSLGFTMVGVNSSDFTIQTVTCGSYLMPGDTCTVAITFTPSAAGARHAAWQINSTAANSPQVIPLTGAGIASSGSPLTFSPSSLSFTLAGVPQTLTVMNYSNSPVTIGSISTDSIGSQTNNCPQILDAQSICSISVEASSVSTTPLSGALTITDSASATPQQVPVSVAASAAQFSAAPINFGSWAVGYSAQAVTVFAFGNKPYPPSINPAISGPNASDFYVADTWCYGDTCRAYITFTPSGTGTRTATLVTYYGNIALSGIGIPDGPSFSLSSSLRLISTPLNTSVSLDSITVVNNGSSGLALSQASISGPNASDFSVTNGCSDVLPPAYSCRSLSVVFTPSQVGTRTATLTVTDSLSGISKAIQIAGVGFRQAPPPTLTPASLNFGNIEIGSQSSPQTVSVSTFSGDPVEFLFTYPQFPMDTTTCAVQTPCEISVVFAPSTAGKQPGSVTVVDAITRAATTLNLTGTGGVPIVSLSANSLTFAARNQGTVSIPQTITVTNTGDISLTIGSISFIGANPTDFSIQSNTCGSSVAAGANCSIGISFSPTASGQRSASLQITSNATSSPDTVQLSGTGN